MSDDRVRAVEAAKILGIPTSEVYQLFNDGALDDINPGGALMFSRSQVEQLKLKRAHSA